MKTLSLILSTLSIVLVSLFATPLVNAMGIAASPTEVAAVAVGANLVASFFNFQSFNILMAATITTTELATELQDFWKVNAGLPKSWIYSMEVQLNKYARRITAIKGKYHAPHAIMSHVVQGFEAVWNEMGATKIKSNELKNYRQKVNFPIVPDDIEGTYLAWANEENRDHKDRSISRFIAEELGKKVVDDADDLSINGEYDENDLGTYGKSQDGIVKILADAVAETIAQTATNPVYLVPLSAFTENNMVEQVTAFEKAVPTRLKKFIKRVYIGTDKLQDYILDYEDTFNTATNYKEGDTVKTRLNKWDIVGLDKLSGSNLIFATPDDNLLHLIDLFDKPQVTDIQKDNYKVKIFMEWWNGYGFYYNQMVFVGHTGSESGYNDATTTADYLPEEASGSGA